MKNKISVLILLLTITIPQVVFAAWWNPFSWKIFHRSSNENSKEVSISTTTPTEQDKYNELNKKIEDLEKRLSEKEKQPETKSAPLSSKIVQSQSVNTSIQTKSGSSELSNKEIIDLVKPAVVYIKTANGSGSGFIFDTTGYILTNAHVVEGFSTVEITLSNKRKLSANVIGINNKNSDVAVLKLDNSGIFPSIMLGNSDNVFQGDEIFAFGFPLGVEGEVSFKEGTLSRKLENESIPYLEMSTEIVKGNSGGPLINRRGEIIGINTLRVGSGVDNLRLAIAINHIKKEIQDLKDGKQLLKNKERSIAESTFRSQLSSLNTKISDNVEISKAISNAYNQSSFDYNENQILSGIDSINSSQDNLRKSYLEAIMRGYKILIPALETFKNLTKSFNDSYSDNQTYLGSISNNYQHKKLTEFGAYTSSKIIEYDKKIGETYGKISTIEDIIRGGNLKNLSTQYFLQQRDLFKVDVTYITKQKEDFLSMLWIRLLF